jgi:hypothetical protein
MGRNTTTPEPQSLDRFSIGEIRDLSGVPIFYNAGTSKWLKSGQSTEASNLSATARTNLANAGTAVIPTVIGQSSLALSYAGFGMYANYPIARIPASNISVVPSLYQASTAVGVGVVTSAGLQAVATGQTSIRTGGDTSGGNGVVASNDTTIFSYTFTSATALNAYTTTNGTTWTSGSVTGLPTFAADGSTIAIASEVNSGAALVCGHSGWRRSVTSYAQFGVFWCGARFLLIGPGATNYVVSLSTDGLAWGGNNTTAVIGATAQAKTVNIQFYRNGNNCYFNVGTAYRYSTDGGITWAACTFAAAPDPSAYYLQYNQTDPAKLVIWTTSGYPAYYTADSGATWSANRALPSDNISGGLAYRGSTLVASNDSSTIFYSTNDGVSWTASTLPIGTLGRQALVMCDANRFYMPIINQAQVLISSDGVTWTIASLPYLFTIKSQSGYVGPGLISFDSNVVSMIGYSEQTGYSAYMSTADGGVTWTMGQFLRSNNGGNWKGANVYLTPDGGGIAFQTGQSLSDSNAPKVFRSDVLTGGAFYRTGATAITPIQANSATYVRVD